MALPITGVTREISSLHCHTHAETLAIACDHKFGMTNTTIMKLKVNQSEEISQQSQKQCQKTENTGCWAPRRGPTPPRRGPTPRRGRTR